MSATRKCSYWENLRCREKLAPVLETPCVTKRETFSEVVTIGAWKKEEGIAI